MSLTPIWKLETQTPLYDEIAEIQKEISKSELEEQKRQETKALELSLDKQL